MSVARVPFLSSRRVGDGGCVFGGCCFWSSRWECLLAGSPGRVDSLGRLALGWLWRLASQVLAVAWLRDLALARRVCAVERASAGERCGVEG